MRGIQQPFIATLSFTVDGRLGVQQERNKDEETLIENKEQCDFQFVDC